ncbi:Ac76E_2 protein, partial [Gryllus bimaculatus]
MSTPGIELLTRNGFDSVQNNRRESIDPRKESLSSQTTDERNWSWKYLRDQFGLKNMEDLYELYQQRLHRGYFSVFLLLQMLLCLAHVIVMCILGEIHDVLPDIITYLVVVILCFLLVIVTFQERLVKRYQWIPLITSCVIIVLLVLSDIGLPLYHNTTKKSPVIFRPAYGVHTLLACYIFLPVTHNLQALILGITVTLCHVVALGMFVYVKSDNKYPR